MGPKWPICPENIFLVQPIILTFIYLLALFNEQNLNKFLKRIQSYEDAPFLGPKWSICPQFFFFFWKSINIILNYLLAPFNEQNFKKILPAKVKRMRNFWAQNSPFPQMRIFSENLMSLVSFNYVYLHAKNQSQILIY